MSEKLNIDSQINEIDIDIANQEWFIKRAEALKELMKDENFKLVILEGYLELEANRVFELLTHPLTVKPEDKSNYLSQLDTIKNMGRYLGCENYKGTVNIQAINAKETLEKLIALKQELIASGKGE